AGRVPKSGDTRVSEKPPDGGLRRNGTSGRSHGKRLNLPSFPVRHNTRAAGEVTGAGKRVETRPGRLSMPQVNLSSLNTSELRRLLDATRARGDAAQSYRILQEMAARRESREQRTVFPMRRPAEPQLVTVDLGDPMEPADELPPMPSWRAPLPEPEPAPEPPPRRSRGRK